MIEKNIERLIGRLRSRAVDFNFLSKDTQRREVIFDILEGRKHSPTISRDILVVSRAGSVGLGRALPDEDIAKFYAEMGKIINDPEVKIKPLPATRPPSPATRLDTEMYRVLERVSKQIYPGVTVLPSMSTGASDKA